MSTRMQAIIAHSWRCGRVPAALAFTLGLAGCSMQMLATIPFEDAVGQSCRSAAGAYFLPKKLISFRITQVSDTAPFVFNFDGTSAVADRTRAFCLDYLGSAFAEDTVHVVRDRGLLTLVSSVAEDKSKEIAEALIEVGVIGATGNPNFSITRSARIKDGTSLILAQYRFDPFDREQLAEINAAIAPTYGYCLIVDEHTVAPAQYRRYCDNPRGTLQSLGPPIVYKAPPGLVELPPLEPYVDRTGILYRPNLTHQLLIMRRRDPGSKNPFEPFQTTRIEMPNLAPVFSIGVERSAFVKRTTRLDFDLGVLRDITVEKPSELVEFMEIPLVIAQAIVKIPAEVIKVRLASTSNQKLLIDAQRELLATQRAYAASLKEIQDKAAASAAAGAGLRSGVNSPSGLARALGSQVTPERSRMVDDLCRAACFEPACTLDQCRQLAAEQCPGQEVQVCLPPLLPQ